MTYYILDENNNRIPVTTEVLTRLVDQIKCCVSGTPFSIAFISQAKYNELERNELLQSNTIYEITDDTTADDLDAQLKTVLITLGKQQETIAQNKAEFDNKVMHEHNVEISAEWTGTYPRGGGNLELQGKFKLFMTAYNYSQYSFYGVAELNAYLEALPYTRKALSGTFTLGSTTYDVKGIMRKYRAEDGNTIDINNYPNLVDYMAALDALPKYTQLYVKSDSESEYTWQVLYDLANVSVKDNVIPIK